MGNLVQSNSPHQLLSATMVLYGLYIFFTNFSYSPSSRYSNLCLYFRIWQISIRNINEIYLGYRLERILDENFNSLLAVFQTSCSSSKLQLEESVLPAHQRLLGSSTWGKIISHPHVAFLSSLTLIVHDNTEDEKYKNQLDILILGLNQ